MELSFDWQFFIKIVLIVLIGSASFYFLFPKKNQSQHILVYLPNRDIAAFTQIQDDSVFSPVMFDAKDVSNDMLLDKNELMGAYLIEPVKANNVIRRSQLVIPPSDEFTHQTRIVSIPVSAISAWHGEIEPGEIVSIWTQPKGSEDPLQPVQILPKALVLKVQKAEVIPNGKDGQIFFVALIIPADHFKEILTSALSESIMFVPAQL